MKILFLALGGALGTLLRYGVSVFAQNFRQSNFPFATLTVNLLGSFAIGLLWGMFERNPVSENMRMFLFVGLLGGFTTFSAFSAETMNLFRSQETVLALGNILANNVLGILLAFAGFYLSQLISKQ
jgi:CrcB protein